MTTATNTKTESTRRELILGVLTLCSLFLVYLLYDHFIIQSQSPPSERCSLSELLEKIGPPARLSFINEDNQDQIVWIGHTSSLAVRSGPPCYLFDTSGHLIAWTSETSEGGRFDNIIMRAYAQPPITLDEAREMSD